MNPPNLLIALENPTLNQDLVYLLKQLEGKCTYQEQNPGDWGSVLDKAGESQPDIVVMEMKPGRAEFASSVRTLRKAAPRTKVIAVHSGNDPDSILSAMQAGANEFIFPPLEDTLLPALNRVVDASVHEQRSESKGKVIGLLSAKGGCGATTLACHIAEDLRIQTNQNVLLADLDLTSGMVGFLMKVASPYSVLDAVTNLSRLDKSLWDAMATKWKPGISVLASPEDFSHEHAPSADDVRKVIRFLRTQYDWIVLDLGRSFNEIASSVFQDLDQLLLISVLEVSALHGVKSIVQKFKDRGENLDKLQLVLNRTPKMMDISADELERILGRSLYAMLPNDYPSLYQAYSTGSLLPQNNRLAQHFATLTARIAGTKAEKQKKKFSLFR
jgi:pilus assembly protein CpaE